MSQAREDFKRGMQRISELLRLADKFIPEVAGYCSDNVFIGFALACYEDATTDFKPEDLTVDKLIDIIIWFKKEMTITDPKYIHHNAYTRRLFK